MSFQQSIYKKKRRYVRDKGRVAPTIEENPDFAYFLGVIVGDASIYDGRISLTAKDREFRDKFAEIGRNIVAKEPQCYEHRSKGKSYTEIRFYSPTFVRQLQLWLGLNEATLGNILGARTHNPNPRAFTKIFDFIQLSRKNDKAFIAGFYDSEGTLYYQKCKLIVESDGAYAHYLGMIEIYNSNRELLECIQALLSSFFKIESSLRLKHPKGFVQFSAQKILTEYSKDHWHLRIRKQASVKEFAHSIHSSIPRKNLKLETSFQN